VAVKRPLLTGISRYSDHPDRSKAPIRPPEPEARKRPALLGEVIGGRSRTTTRLSPALLSTLGEWTPGHMGQTALDAVGFLPLIGALKSIDEEVTLPYKSYKASGRGHRQERDAVA